MGEYGFVTGDGVYHVTVYATDENGDFKIISMKNYYVGLREYNHVLHSSAFSSNPNNSRVSFMGLFLGKKYRLYVTKESIRRKTPCEPYSLRNY